MKRFSALLLLVLLATSLFAVSYNITSYDIQLDVEETGLMHVTETLTVHFNEAAHGIYRDIQYSFANPDGNEFDPIRATVSNFQTNTPFKTSKEDGYIRYKLGDEKAYAKETETYTFSYDYKLDYDRYSDYDELYYNLISPAWDCTIENITWRVNLPKPTSKGSVYVSAGDYGDTDKSFFMLENFGSTISGKKAKLANKEAITIRIEMPEGYWTDMTPPIDNSSKTIRISLYLSILALIATIALWSFYGDDEPLLARKRKTPPTGLSPMEVGYLQDQTIAMDKEILSMIFYWAGKGFLSIEESKKTVDKKTVNEYTLTKLKEINEDAPSYEKKLFQLVFTKDRVTTEDIAASDFYGNVMKDVIPALTKEYTKGEKRMRSKKSLIVQLCLLALWFVLGIVTGVLFSQKYPGFLGLVFSLLFFFHFMGVVIVFGLWSDQGHIWSRKKQVWMGIAAFLVNLLMMVFGLILSDSAHLDMALMAKAVPLAFLIQTIGIAVSCFADQRSAFGNKALEECVGYRKYLLTTPYSKIADVEKENPGFFNEAMPYALAMGIGKEWSEKAKKIEGIVEPTWFTGSSTFPTYLFYYMVFSSYRTSYNSSQMHVPATAGGSGFHSSGFAGGGFSGGGGGAW